MQLESNSSEIARITKELQAERQSVLALTNKRSELVVELESLRSHTFKVEVLSLMNAVDSADREAEACWIARFREGELHGWAEGIHHQADKAQWREGWYAYRAG